MRYVLTVTIDRPIDVVWNFMADVFNVPLLRGQALVFRQTSSGPVAVGTTYEGRAMVLGFEVHVGAVVTEWDPPRASTTTMSLPRALRSFSSRETFETTTGGTKVTRVFDIEPRSIYRLLWPILGPFIVRRWRTATLNIKAILESSPVDELAGDGEPAVSAGLAVHRTIMFTDVVSSTALIEVIGDAAWRDLRRWHDTTLRAAFERHRGHELDHAGDGFCVAFPSAADGVACAVDIERTLLEHRRSAGFAPQLRIGLHTGDLQRDGEGLTGSALHVAARVAAAADGGQILATSATLDEAGVTPASPPSQVSLRGVGEPMPLAPIAW